jgi:PHD/YefM family antitoxin component YafN of YafNO toxin-antitoxin module
MKTIISLDELRKNLTDIAGQVIYGNATVRVRKYNREGMVLMSEKEYERLEKILDPRKRFTQEEWEQGFGLMDKMRENTKQYPAQEVEAAIATAVADVRQKSHV